ncbi:MAG: D-aminoacyl-tRNA deacylase [Flavonifractor plautii]
MRRAGFPGGARRVRRRHAGVLAERRTGDHSAGHRPDVGPNSPPRPRRVRAFWRSQNLDAGADSLPPRQIKEPGSLRRWEPRGAFGADMQVYSQNDGPVTILLDTDQM